MPLFNNRNDNKPNEPTEADNKNWEVDKLNAEINQLEDEISSLYADIGQEYYSSCPDNPLSEQMANNYREIDNRRASIQNATDEIRTLKGITSCQYCGADILVTDTFCGSCGARIISEVTVSPSGGVCPICGRPFESGQQFCSTCGAKLNVEDSSAGGAVYEEEVIVEETTEPMPASGPNPESDAGNDSAEVSGPSKESGSSPAFCINCGAPIHPGDQYCIKCGRKVGDD